MKSKVKLDLVEEVILDLEYDNHLGRLTDIEKEVLQDACAIHKDLTGRRGAYQKSLLLTLGKTLGKEAQHLASRADRVETQIHQLLLQPSKRADDLKTAYNDLVKEKEEVEQKVSDLDGLLQAYLANEKKFIELAKAKADAERQLLVLQGMNDAGPICQQRLPGRRRSFSMTTLELDENEGRKLMDEQKANDSGGLTEAQRAIIETKRQQALALQRAKVVANDRKDVYISSNRSLALSQTVDSAGGFFLEPEWSSQPTVPDLYEKSEEEEEEDVGIHAEIGRKRRRRCRLKKRALATTHETVVGPGTVHSAVATTPPPVVPIPPDESQSVCDECVALDLRLRLLRNSATSFSCRDPHGIHSLITRTSAKERYLLNDVDLDVRTPALRCIFKRNPHNAIWGDMRLYLEAQVAARSLEIWGSEEALEAERIRRSVQRENLKLKSYEKKLKSLSMKSFFTVLICLGASTVTSASYDYYFSYKHSSVFSAELRMQTRSSLFSKKSEQHEHSLGAETYDEAKDIYFKTCATCNFRVEFEKL
ncbi:unnamed protein product [Schistocephalus solidus]|uniref:XPA C-terminal domain-containing protein n=1 Tax=Schistocephalus solidus TaxID=70667 RepID=A0A3P7CMU0_SCHSO|nr:unnamed protein product [Schistocephalus solidus]